ncbi:MAG TPA: hypothetical protein VKJ65_11780, partial [Phycisphaerae bacterium]|nr:hypothetical protein [Phycisphaerae bacterium]
YTQIQTVNLTAQAHGTTYGGIFDLCGPRTLIYNDYFSYTADHEKYNILCKDDLLNSGPSWVRYAYNGERFQSLSMLDLNMGYQKADSDQLVLGINNPFFEAVRFLSQANDSNITYAIKLSYLQKPTTLKNLLSKVTWLPSSTSNSEAVAILPGSGTVDGKPFEYYIYFAGKINFLPTRIEMLTGNLGNTDLFWRMDIKDYGMTMVAGKPFYWPRTIEQSLRAANVVLVDKQINVTSCQLNQPVNQSDFTLDPKLANQIIDWDTHTSIYQNSNTLVPTPIPGGKE